MEMTGTSVVFADAEGSAEVSLGADDVEGQTREQQRAGEEERCATLRKDHHYRLCFRDVTFTATVSELRGKLLGIPPGEKRILQGITGYVDSGQMLAIMGPSGAGKTTLLDVLSQQPAVYRDKGVQIGGVMEVDGHTLDRDFFMRHCSYVPQEDRLWAALTVRENLQFGALFYRGTSLSEEQRNELVDQVINSVGLQSCQDVYVGNIFLKGISGGQKRRASIALELTSRAEILFLDEPTSGLDAASASSIMELLNNIAVEQNHIVVTSIHQPATQIFQRFDRLILLTKGRTAFFGPARDAMAYFSNLGRAPETQQVNPADFLLEITNSDFFDEAAVLQLADAWEASEPHKTMHNMLDSDRGLRASSSTRQWTEAPRYAAAPLVQVSAIARRSIINYRRDPASYLGRFGLYLFMSVFLGSVYYKAEYQQSDVLNLVYGFVWLSAFFGYSAMMALPAFSLEIAAVGKESANGMYHPVAYTTACALVQAPFCALLSLICVTPYYWIVGLNPRAEVFWLQVTVFFFFLYCVESFAVLVGTSLSNFVIGLGIFCTAVSMSFVFNGLFISVNNIPEFWIWLHYIAPHKYTYEAMLNTDFATQSFSGLTECLLEGGQCWGRKGEDVLANLSSGGIGLSSINVGKWIAVLCGFALFYRVVHYIVLVRRV